MRGAKRRTHLTTKHKGGKENRRHDFLRMDPQQLVGNGTSSILYRLFKSGLRSMSMSRDVKQIDFDEENLLSCRDLDYVLLERMRMYTKYGKKKDDTDDHWFNIIRKTLFEKNGMRFEENNKRYYLFPTCVFVCNSSQPYEDDAKTIQSTSIGATTDYYKTNKYQHSEEEANALLDERRNEQAKHARESAVVQFVGFTIEVNDGRQDAVINISGKKSGGAPLDNTTFYRYLNLEQSVVEDTTAVASSITDLHTQCSNTVQLLKNKLKELLGEGKAHTVRVDIGDNNSTNSAHFSISYNAEHQRTAYNQTTQGQLHNHKFYRTHGDDQKKHFDLDTLIAHKIHDDNIKSYLCERGDLSREKRIVLRYENVENGEDQYIIYSFQIANAACKMAGDTIHIVSRSLEPNISAPHVKHYSFRESSAKYQLHTSSPTSTASKNNNNNNNTFNPNSVVPVFTTPADDDEDSSMEESIRENDTHREDTPQQHQHSTDPTVRAFVSVAGASNMLTFLGKLVFEVVQETSRSWSSVSTMKAGEDGVYRTDFATNAFGALRTDHNEPFRMNSDYMFMHLLLTASHHMQALSYMRSTITKASSKPSAERVFMLVSGTSSLQQTGAELFHEHPPVASDTSLTKAFMEVFCKDLSSSSKSFGTNQTSLITTNHILENIRLFYKEKLSSLTFHLQERDDPEEFFLCLERRGFWPLYSKRIQCIHGAFYKDIVQKRDHDYFLRRLFYYQLRNVVFPKQLQNEELTTNTTKSNIDKSILGKRIPTYYTDQPEFSALVSDAHRTLLNLRSLRYEPPTNVGAYSINVLQQYGAHQKKTSSINLALARNKTATDDMLENVHEADTQALNKQIQDLMRSYKISDTSFIAELQRKNTRLLFHFLHMVENNGALDTLGNLHVTYRDVRDIKLVLQEALRIKSNESGGNMFAQKKFFSSSSMKGTSLEKIGTRLFSLEPFLTLDQSLLKKMHRKNGLRYMLMDWSNHGNLFWNIMDFKHTSSLFSSRFSEANVSAFKLYVFMPSYIYLTREIRNLIPHLETNGRATLEAIIKTQEAMQDKNTAKMYETEGIDSVVRGLIFGIQQELLHTSEANLYIMCITDKKGVSNHWLFGHWQRQYVLYELGGNVVGGDKGLNQLLLDPRVMNGVKRIGNLLDEKVYESSEDMLASVRRWRQEVENKTELHTTVKNEMDVRLSRKRRRSSMRKKMDMYGQINNSNNIAHLQAADKTSHALLTKKEKVYELVKILQTLAFRPSVLPKKNTTPEKLFDSKPYQNNPMCATMWLLFRELYTFMPSMYNHVIMTMNDRLRYAEMGLALNSGGLFQDGTLVPRKEPLALADKGFQYYVGTNEERKSRQDRRNFLLFIDKMHENTDSARIHRRHFFQMVLENLAQLGAVQDSSMSFHETEHAEIRVMPWIKYVAHEDVGKRIAKNKLLIVSSLLSGILASNAILGNPALRLAFRLVNPSGVTSTVTSPLMMIAKKMLPVLCTPSLATFAIGATMGVSGTFAALAKTAGMLSQGYQEGAESGGVMTGVSAAFQKALFGAAQGMKSGAEKNTQSLSNKVMDSLSHYLITNIYMYRVKVRFLHNGNKYVWKFDMGVDRATNRVLMYHGMRDAQQNVTAYRDIQPDRDSDLRKIREHKMSQKKRRRSSSRKRTSHENRNYNTRTKKRRLDMFRKRARESRRNRYVGQYA